MSMHKNRILSTEFLPLGRLSGKPRQISSMGTSFLNSFPKLLLEPEGAQINKGMQGRTGNKGVCLHAKSGKH